MGLFSKSERDGLSTSGYGSHEDVLKIRRQVGEQFEKGIETILENYDGELVAVIRVVEDENGNPEQTRTFIGGVAGAQSTEALKEGLLEAVNTIRERSAGVGVDKTKIKDALRKLIDEMED